MKARRRRNGTYTLMVQYLGQRRQLTLGKVGKSHADHFTRNVELLIEHAKFATKSFPAELQAWIAALSDRHKVQLGEMGFFDYRKPGMTAGDLFDRYVDDYESRTDVEPSTKTKVRSMVNNRTSRLSKIKLDTLEPAQRAMHQAADPIWTDEAKRLLTSFHSWQKEHLARSTWSRDNKLLRSIGIWAVKHGFCAYSPFGILPASDMVNDSRNEYLSAEMVEDAMEACLSPDIRLTLALGRFGGLRTDSEVRTLKWSHVDSSAGTLTIIDSKTKRPRKMPLFQSIADELEKQREHTGESRFVASPRMRGSSSSSNYQQIRDAISRSGQEIWMRVRQNLRTSCENDLLEHFDERLVTQWLGHTIRVSRQHYQKLRPRDYHQAIETLANNS